MGDHTKSTEVNVKSQPRSKVGQKSQGNMQADWDQPTQIDLQSNSSVNPDILTPTTIMHLQRTIGNQATQRLIRRKHAGQNIGKLQRKIDSLGRKSENEDSDTQYQDDETELGLLASIYGEPAHGISENDNTDRAHVSNVAANNSIQRRNGDESDEPSKAIATPYDRIQDYVEDAADLWKQNYERASLAIKSFTNRMTFASEEEAVPDVAGAVISHSIQQVTQFALGKVEGLVPGYSQVKGLVDVMGAELERASKANQELKLRNYIEEMGKVLLSTFEKQHKKIKGGRQELADSYNSITDESIKEAFLDSFDNWNQALEKRLPTVDEYLSVMFIEWINRHQGMLSGFQALGRLEIKFNAEEPGKYEFESAKIMMPNSKKVASALNWIMSTKELEAPNILHLPIKKAVGLYTENLVGGTSYGWFHLDEGNNTTQKSVLPVAKKRWNAMSWEPFKKITKVTGM